MNAENALPALLSAAGIGVDEAQSGLASLRMTASLGLVASTSARVGNLLGRAMTFFETNREVAWRCLTDASTLLGSEAQQSVINAPVLQSTFRPSGLAAWQAKRTVAYIEANLGSKMAVAELADLLALSESHFSRAFKQRLGFSPMAYVGVRRVERAKFMMISTSERLADIAAACGFADQSHFNRYFRRAVGISPGRWRRMFESSGGVGEVSTATVGPAVASAPFAARGKGTRICRSTLSMPSHER